MAYLGEYACRASRFLSSSSAIPSHRRGEANGYLAVSPASTLASDVDAIIERILHLDPNAAGTAGIFPDRRNQNSSIKLPPGTEPLTVAACRASRGRK